MNFDLWIDSEAFTDDSTDDDIREWVKDRVIGALRLDGVRSTLDGES